MLKYAPLFLFLVGTVFLSSCSKKVNGPFVVQGQVIVSPQPSNPPPTIDPPPQEEPRVQGVPVSQYYLDSCSGCHGVNREGTIGPALLPQRLSQPDGYYFDVIENGKPGTLMPAWGNTLTDEEINLLIAFIRSEPDPSALEWNMEDIQGTAQILVNEGTLSGVPTHSGNIDNLMLITEREVSSIAVVDGDTHTLLTKIPASYRAHGYVFDPTNERWAFNMGRDGWVFKIDLYTLQAVRKIRVGLDSRGLAISDNGQFLIAGNFLPATAVILNAQTLEPLQVISTRAENMEGEMVDARVAIVSDVSPVLVGSYFIIALKEAGQMWRIDWSQPNFPITTIANVGHVLHDGFLSPDNTRFYIASQTDNWMSVIDVANWTLITQISTGDAPHPGSGATWTSGGNVYGATVHIGEGKVTVWDLATNNIAGTVTTTGPGLFLRSHENSPYVWADAVFSTQPSITIFEKNPPFTVVNTITEGLRSLHPEFTEEGDFVYIPDWDGNVIRVYNATTFVKVAEIPNITTPTGVFNSSRRDETLGH